MRGRRTDKNQGRGKSYGLGKGKKISRRSKPEPKEEGRELPRRIEKANRYSAKKKRYPKRDRAEAGDTGVRLNKFIANSGVCSRRDADKLIADGLITINGKVVTAMGTKVMPGDVVKYGGDALSFEKFVYLLMNKPKDFITTVDDPQGRRTVLDIVGPHVKERVYPVGRLDRATTGLLLLTNDGDLAKKLTHPSFEVKKVYHATTSKSLTKEELAKLAKGVHLEDGFVKPDSIAFLADDGPERKVNTKEVGIELHSGKNRVIRRMFESIDHKVIKLDRVMFAGLTKKRLRRGQWRHLNEKEIGLLKML